MKLAYTESIPSWLHLRANELISRRPNLAMGEIHITQLLQPAPMLSLQQQHWEELTVSPDDLIPALLGTAWHRYMEDTMGPAGYAERRMTVNHNEWDITGTPDWFDKSRVIDFKTARSWSAIFGKPEWEQQLNLYRWLIHQATGLLCETLEVHAIYTDWSETQALRTEGYPRRRWEVINVPVWTLEEADSFLMSRIQAIEDVRLGDVCTAEERWERGEHWATMKNGRKTALRKHDTLEAAEEMAATVTGGYVEHRPGKPVRCESWCSVKSYCPFGQGLGDE